MKWSQLAHRTHQAVIEQLQQEPAMTQEEHALVSLLRQVPAPAEGLLYGLFNTDNGGWGEPGHTFQLLPAR